MLLAGATAASISPILYDVLVSGGTVGGDADADLALLLAAVSDASGDLSVDPLYNMADTAEVNAETATVAGLPMYTTGPMNTAWYKGMARGAYSLHPTIVHSGLASASHSPESAEVAIGSFCARLQDYLANPNVPLPSKELLVKTIDSRLVRAGLGILAAFLRQSVSTMVPRSLAGVIEVVAEGISIATGSAEGMRATIAGEMDLSPQGPDSLISATTAAANGALTQSYMLWCDQLNQAVATQGPTPQPQP